MLRTLATRTRSARRRSGAVLIVVLAMLVLFAVLGLSFVLYSEAQLSAARAQKLSVNEETEPNAQAAAEWWMSGLIYDVNDTGDDLMNPVRGHSLSRTKHGYRAGLPNLLPYSAGTVLPQEAVTVGGVAFADSRQIVRFTFTPGGGVFDPERVYGGLPVRANATDPLVGTYQGKNYPFTYPDRHDFYLAQMDPITGRIVVPSFHRPDLGNWTPGDPLNFETQGAAGRFRTLRPRVADGHTNFPPVPPNADGSYTGDVANMKMTSGSQRNDSYWMDAGGPVLKWRGKFYKAMVAPLVLDLNGRVNLSTAGNLKNITNNPLAPHGSNHGLGPWEVNPMQLGLTAADLQAIMQRKYGRSGAIYTPQADPYTTAANTTHVNRARMAPSFSLFDADGVGSTANDSAPALPAAGGFNSFPTFNSPLVVAPTYRHEPNPAALTGALADHPAQFNPLLHPRTPNNSGQTGGFGHDDLVKLYGRFSDPKNRQATTTSLPQGTTLATNNAVRAATTTFSTTQRWAGVGVTAALSTAPGTTFTTTLGPVDVNRPLPDFRKNTALALSPVNLWDATVLAEQPYFSAAVSARQRLARDIFVRLCARYGLITNPAEAVYLVDTGVVDVRIPTTHANYPSFAAFAQLAVNMVDYLDNDDIVTAFAWRPFTPTAADPNLDANNFLAAEMPSRVAFGTEQPRLVLNEVYSCVANTRDDPFTGAIATRPLKRQYWVELHNPTPPEPTALPRSDQGAARLQYQSGVTQVTDPTSLAVGNYTGPTFNPYRLEIAEVPQAGGVATPYTNSPGGGNGAAATDPATLLGATATVRVRVNTYTQDPMATPSALTLDGYNVVLPVTGTAGANGSNQGYYLIGPRDQFPTAPAGGVTNSLSLRDPAAGVPATPVDALTYDVTAGAPTVADIGLESLKSNVVILRRLLDPYRPAQENPATPATYNPYITVDYLENVPTRDRTTAAAVPGARTPSNAPTVGRIHPSVAFPTFGTGGALDGVQVQVNAAITTAPPHTLFGINNPSDNNRPTATPTFGFEWRVHLDREAVSLPELAHVSRVNPTALTQTFFNGTTYHGNEVGLTPAYRWLIDAAGLLDTAPRLPGGVLGGREGGRVNPNTAANVNVLSAVLDPQAGNGFAATNPALATNAWGTSVVTAVAPGGTRVVRTPNGTPRATVYEVGATGTEDHPFAWGSGTWAGTADGLLDRRTTTATTDPLAFGNTAASGGHPYFQYEPMQKLWNNLTPVSDSFLVVLTFGFFEVTPTNAAQPIGVNNPPLFGAELFDKVSGDLRVQFAGVIDRSNLAVADPAAPTTPAANSPFQTKLTTDATVGNTALTLEAAFVLNGGLLPDGTTATADTAVLYGDGPRRFLAVTNGTRLRVGYGDSLTNTGDGEWLVVNTVTQRTILTASGTVNVPGEVSITLGAGPTRCHGAGALVSDAVFGNPGPQANVTLAQLKQRGLVPYFTRLEP